MNVAAAQSVTFESPRLVAPDKIAERDAALVVRVNKTSTEVDEDDPYADYKIPDDFTW